MIVNARRDSVGGAPVLYRSATVCGARLRRIAFLHAVAGEPESIHPGFPRCKLLHQFGLLTLPQICLTERGSHKRWHRQVRARAIA